MYSFLRKLLYKLDAETAHEIVSGLGRVVQALPGATACMRRFNSVENQALEVEAFGLKFRSPVGLAAGFDKNARLIPFFYGLGFGFTEIGSVTALPRQGNPRPRLFRLMQDQALVNRMGLNNWGTERIMQNIPSNRPYPVGVNIAKTHDPNILEKLAIDDFLFSFKMVVPVADYVVLNVSCPNTKEGKTFESENGVRELLQALDVRCCQKPVLIKISPDITPEEFEKVLNICLAENVKGLVLTNTSGKREGLMTASATIDSIGKGGLSGKPIFNKSVALIKLASRLAGNRLKIIGCGGIDSPEAAYSMIRAGAVLVQLYTGLVYRGPAIAQQINSGLLSLMQRDGFKQIAEAVGVDAQKP